MMVKYREILRLKAAGISVRSIARSCKCSTATVNAVAGRAKAIGLEWPLPEEMGDAAIRSVLYPQKSRSHSDKAPIDFEYVERELSRRNVTLMLLWHEYCEQSLAHGKEPYLYSAFCQKHRAWADKNAVTMHIERRPGEQMQVDWAGDTMEVCDKDTGEFLKVYVFVACLPYSSLLYARGFFDMKEDSWVRAHIDAFSFFKGTTLVLVPDNCKTAVVENTVEQLIVNEQYRRMAEYYGCAIIPARPGKPRDKGSVEMGVGIVERQAIAALRNRVFFDIRDLNMALLEKVEEINKRPFQKRPGSRESVFLGQEMQALVPLPSRPYEMSIRRRATVNFNYHVSFEGNWYSVPFQYVRREVEIVAKDSSVAIVCDGQRIAMHMRSHAPSNDYVTDPDHMPESHRDFAEWSGERFRSRARECGPATERVADAILASRKLEQQSYRSCRALLSLGQKHGDVALETACERALEITKRPSYKTVKAILAKVVEERAVTQEEHAYIRGNDYYMGIEEEM